MRFVIISIVALLAAPFLIVGGWVGYGMWREHAFNRNTPLAANLYGQWDAMRDTFRQRLRKDFPIGTPVTNVVAELVAQAFAPNGKASPDGLTRPDAETAKLDAMPFLPRMTITGPGGVCTVVWTVAWELDAHQRVTQTYGELGGYCL